MSRSIFETLRDDHDSQRALIRELRITTETTERNELFESLRDELRAHDAAEARVLYDRLRQSPTLQSQVRSQLKDHEEIERRLSKLERTNSQGPKWSTRFARLAEFAEYHMDEEECNMFPLARQVIDPDECRSLHRDYAREKSLSIHRRTP